MRKYLALILITLPVTALYAETKSTNKSSSDEEEVYFKDETIESCYDKGVSVAIQNCLGFLSGEKEDAYEATFNSFIKDITAIKAHFFDFKLFVKLVKKTKLNWDRNIKDECLAEATLDEKDGYTYHYSYSQCLIKAYESRTKFYQDYREKIPALEYYADEVAGKK